MSVDTARCPHCQAHVDGPPVPAACPACGRPLPAAPGGRRMSWPLVAAIAILSILGIGYSVTSILDFSQSEELSADPSGTPDPTQRTGPVASELAIERPGGGSGSEGREPAVVSLRRPAYHEVPDGVDESILAHEIVRQAVLSAVRDTGALVRDAVVGDNVPSPEAQADLEVSPYFPPRAEPVLILARRTAKGREVLATFVLGKPAGEFVDYVAVVERAEALSRAGDGIPAVLAKVGLKGTAAATTDAGAPADEVEPRLARMTFTEQLAAVRLIHAEIRDHGESPERLGALARGYANLSVLTEFHWGSRHKALQARALLAAQRLAARSPGSPLALWHRAYVRALIGFHKDALDDLAAAGTLAKGDPNAAKPPSWVALIDALCRFRTPDLLTAREGADGPLAMLLAFLSFEESVAGVPRVVSLGQEVLQVNPECYRIHARLGRTGGVASWHATTLAGLGAMDRAMPGRLEHFPGIPEAIAKQLAEGAREPEVVKALIATTDRGEPSFAALGRMVADTRFALVYLRARFMAYSWNVPVGDYLDAAWPTVADHPYRAALEAMRLDPRGDRGKFADLLKAVEIPDIGFNEYAFNYQVGMADMNRHKLQNGLILRHGDMIYRDLADFFRGLSANQHARVARDLLERSPYAPQAKMRLAQYDWGYAEPHAREWEETAGHQPDILFGLGSQYLKLKRWDDSIRCFTKLAEMSGDASAYQTLAEVYRAKGDTENWTKTLEKARGKGDVALGSMQIDVDLADQYMRQKQWDKALPHARAAAATWAARGLLCAAHCYEGMGDFEQAESWQRRNTERYPDVAWMGWFIFCKRTGHGDLAAARKFARDHIATLGGEPSGDLLESIGIFRLLEGETREARDLLRRRYREGHTPAPYRGLMLAVLCDDLGDAAERDQVLKEMTGHVIPKEEQLDELLKVIREGLGSKDGRIDSKALVAAVNHAAEGRRYPVSVFAARLLHAHGDPAKASDLLRQAVEMGGHEGWAEALAALWRRDWENPPVKAAPGQGK